VLYCKNARTPWISEGNIFDKNGKKGFAKIISAIHNFSKKGN